MSEQTILVTGGYGCIGSQAVKWFLRNTSAAVIVGSRNISDVRTDRVFFDVDRQRLHLVQLDVRNAEQIEKLLSQQRVTHVVHMAALQTPGCNSNRDLGLQINLAGTQNIIEAMKSTSSKIQRFVFASSCAVYGPRAMYQPGQVPLSAEPRPVNVYGVWKLAGESLSRLFWEETGIPTVCLRPGVLYGPGRDAGLTSTPTTAIKCVALDVAYEIPFCSRQDYLYSVDVGAAVGHASTDEFAAFGVYTLPSETMPTADFAELLKMAANELGISDRFKISVGTKSVPFICDLESTSFVKTFPCAPTTPAGRGVHESLEFYLDQAQRGWLDFDDTKTMS